MKQQELRIGNWVHHNFKWCYRDHGTSFDFQWDDSDWYALGECTMSLDDVSPIPLTEQWLKDFGFELKEDLFTGPGYCIEHEDYFFNIDKESMLFGHPQFNTKIEYVHQLQNLYFALTGKELTR